MAILELDPFIPTTAHLMPILDRKHLLEMMSQLMEIRRILIEHQPPPISWPDLGRVPLPRSIPIPRRDWVRPGDESVQIDIPRYALTQFPLDMAVLASAGPRVVRPLQMREPMVNGIGDTTCAHNAKSPYLRCAINPCGPCEGCGDYSCD